MGESMIRDDRAPSEGTSGDRDKVRRDDARANTTISMLSQARCDIHLAIIVNSTTIAIVETAPSESGLTPNFDHGITSLQYVLLF